MNKRLYEIAGIRVERGIRAEFVGLGALAATTLGAAATPAVAGGAVAGTAAAMGGGAILAGTGMAATLGGVGAAIGTVGSNVAAFGGAGGMGLSTAMGWAGLGFKALDAFSGGNTPDTIQRYPLPEHQKENLKEIDKIEDKDYQQAQAGQLDSNPVSKYIKRYTAGLQSLSRTRTRAANAMGAVESAKTRTDTGVGSAAGSRVLAAGSRAIGTENLRKHEDMFGARKEQMNNALVNYKNSLRGYMGQGAQESGATYFKQGLEQEQRARQGAALGQLASMGGLMGYMSMRGRA